MFLRGLCGVDLRATGGTTAEQHPELPAGPGKDTLIRVCSSCHSPDNVIANGQDRDGWEATITKMAGFGAQGTDDDYTAILEYLVKNFPANPPVNVNKATAAQLQVVWGSLRRNQKRSLRIGIKTETLKPWMT